MLLNWNEHRDELLGKVNEFAKLTPEFMRGLVKMDAGASATGHLDPKIHELIALAVAVTTRCDGCISVHVKAAAKHGATREEIAEALAVAISLNTGAALTYTAHVLDAFDSLPKA
ncbi:MAG: carboxymuconolactone decarboxylase family protein [Ewingella americana]|jgi:AhpD family alkylhydroperoxidase|uniref:Putative carboxymuconolactone decarboxylase family protein n=1 Tax=Ewingella americana (strain ATCC 33852 / DSM 4580 / CCUG 14506 / JCM 5911 / LMG 7869 / NCTC 12157 / CDC 1468-78) TaxID=910964 RepID=A0A085G736_EWIA3|nr:carboxymuconolactone decarboxylase family protein [Ewingella americana]NWA41662.1 carboxymuconolactone decarboxylase family protein [Pseudomonas reactans]KAA8726157.1 carboxymuconolactone decarboxylase family protein [Ewingella americana]KFC79531.1 putative carboxymuconolactone decarboxylase family protein [Ewingella americana ATCC 33852]MCI1677402.1 carboxymuconolactone decarboxylase family protein [Ewingella americana]MCI1852909.1 carboxymuconolactone decarboxylase family protein [Ewingel